MPTSRMFARLMPKEGFAASLDLKDAFFHIPVRKSFRKYLGFAYNKTVWQFRALPFGLSTSPYVFTQIASQMSKFLQPSAIPIHQYLDNWLTEAMSRLRTHQMLLVLHLTEALGWLVNRVKRPLSLYP